MHRHFHQFHWFCAAAAVVFVVVAVACTDKSGDDGATDNTSNVSPPGTRTDTPIGSRPAASAFPAVRQPWPEDQPVEQSEWIKDRLSAMKQVFRFTPAGEEWIDGYDLRQMVEQPAWFGSFGYGSWAGAGEAVPRSVLHEISHSYWGAFSVSGAPDLSWDTSDGTAEVLLEYREQLRLFMLQPPDRFEPLRDRFRNLPGLSVGEYPDLAHFGEADLLYMTGGNLQLIPPILLPYFSGFVAEGGAGASGGISPASWDVAIAWFNSLSFEDWRIAGEVFGLQHFPSQRYVNLPETNLTGLDESVRTLYENEERQRLIDFEAQFDGILDREFALVDAAGADRGFDFWRSYLSDKLALHQRYPQALRNIGSDRGVDLANALDFYAEIEQLSDSAQVERFKEAEQQPLVSELAVLLRPRAIVDLFADSGAGGSGSRIAAVLGSRADRLTALVQAVDDVARAHEQDGSQAGAGELERFIRSVPEAEFRSDAFLLLDLLRSSKQDLANDVLPELSDETLQFTLRVQPAFARSPEIGPERLLEAIGIGENASLDQVRDGAFMLASNSSGNFAIDAQYDDAVFAHFDRFVEIVPDEVLSAVIKSGMRLVPWVDRNSDGALRAMRAEPEAAGEMLAAMDGTRETPWRIIHLVAREDAELAARITIEMGLADDENLSVRVTERVIREFGYDLYWSERNAGPNVSPARFAEFLLALDSQLSDGFLEPVMRRMLADLERDISGGQVESGALTQFMLTLEAAVDSKSGADAERLRELVNSLGMSG